MEFLRRMVEKAQKSAFYKRKLRQIAALMFVPMTALACGVTHMPTPAEAAVPKLTEVPFSETVDPERLVKLYPVTQDLVEEVLLSNGSGINTILGEISVSKVEDTTTRTKLLLVNVRGSDFCGSMGCTLGIYADEGAGYSTTMITALDPTTPLRVMKTEKGISLVICRNGGRPEELLYKQGKFVRNTTDALFSMDPPVCPLPPDVPQATPIPPAPPASQNKP